MKDIICQELQSESLNRICKREGMPARRTVEKWMADDVEFAAKCARAREIHADKIFEDLEEIEEDVLSGTVEPNAAKVVISSRQWRLEKIKPKKYGPKIEATHEVGESIRAVVREIVRP
jgi:hypothetical protein